MTWTEIIAWAKAINEITKEHQKWAFNWIMVTFFGDKYLKYLTKNLIIEWIAKAEAEKQIAHFSSDPNPVMAFIKSENELEYQNMFWVLEKTLPKITSWTPSEEMVDKDKMKRLKDLTKEFSSDEMQEIIAWILAWEYNKPWSYSLKTMEVVKNLTKDDIELFRKFTGIIINDDFIYSNIFSIHKKYLTELWVMWLSWDKFLYLQELWLFSSIETANKNWIWISQEITNMLNKSDKVIPMEYKICWKDLNVWIAKEITLNKQYNLTKAWRELFSLLWYRYNERLFQIVKNNFLELWFRENK